MNGLSFIDLFAGAGGLSTGLEKAGFDLVHAVEIDPDARETFSENRDSVSPDDLSKDIREIDSEPKIQQAVGTTEVDLIVGGPPCQGFSEVVSPDGTDERNHLFENFVNWVEVIEPEAVLFENVRGIQSTAGGKFLDAVEKSFDKLGYDMTPRVVKSSNFGVPQQRRRLIGLATKRPICENPFSEYELNPKSIPGVIDGIGDLPEVAAGEESNKYSSDPQTVLQEDLRKGSRCLTLHQAANHTERMINMIKQVPEGGNKDDITEDPKPSSGFHNSYSRLKPNEPAVAITSNMSKPSSVRCIHPFEHRGLTPREGARLQTFPDKYEFSGNITSVRQQIGNAVPPYLAEAIGYYLKEAVFDRKLTEADYNRIYRIRCGGMSPTEFQAQQDELGGHSQQLTLE